MTETIKPKLTVAQVTTKEAPTWCPGCVLPNTIIHKNPSTDQIENVKIGDKVLGLDGEYHEVYEVLKHKHEGQMFVIKSKCFGESVTTPEHPVLIVKREKFGYHNKTFLQEWVEAEKIRNGDYLVYPILKTVKDLEEVELKLTKKIMDRKSKSLPKSVKITDNLLRLFGYYIAEGWVHERTLGFTFSIKENEYVEDVKNSFKETFGLDAKIDKKPAKSSTDVCIGHTPLLRLFQEWFGKGAANKKIPHFLMLLPKEKQKELIKGFWRGDGYVGKKKAGYKTISKLLTEQIKILLLRQGIVPSISVNRAYKNHRQSYNIEITSVKNLNILADVLELNVGFDIKERYPRYHLTQNYVYIPVRRVDTFNYEGLVYNLEVRDVQSYVTENAILHNCGDFTILSTLKMALVDLNVDTANTLIVSGIGCLPPEEKVSLGNEWVNIGEVEEKQTVINGEGKFDNVAETSIRPFSGSLIKIVPRISTVNSFKLTPEHPVLCVRRNLIRSRNQVDKEKLRRTKPEFIDASDLKKGDYIVFRPNKEIKDNPEYTKDFCRFLGYYLSEGWINRGGGRNRDCLNVSFAFHIKEKKYIEDLKALSLKLFNRKPYTRIRENVIEITVCSKELGLKLINIASKGARKKKLSEEIMLLPPEKQKEIIKGYLRGDAWYGKAKLGRHNLYRASTASFDLAVQVQEIIARAGQFAGIYKKKTKPHNLSGRVINPSGDQYVVSFQPKKEWTNTHKTKYGFLVPISKIEKEFYQGPVCNFETSSNVHSYLVRGFVVHNCGSKTPHFVKTYGFEGLHGRSLPVATAAKLVNPKLTVIAITGDGDGYGIGGNHFMHTMRRNLDMCYIIQDNEVYGLTKGQASPTSEKGFKSPSTPSGVIEVPVNPLTWALVGGATYIARGYAMDIMHLRKLIVEGIKHKGMAIIDVFQPCTTYNKIQTPEWYKQRIYKLDDDKTYDPTNKVAAFQKMQEWGDKIPIGLLYKEERPTYEDHVPQNNPMPVVEQDISNVNMDVLFSKFMQKS